ncbi:cardiomyopathy-associated protein 5 isoform X2 [Clinocottus analis]|uniref:cardiomyopathy-associated protein 5 isoform X2 n=1 Tax=Clinocottus analis TaxID=304258 RepID=UPI0035C16B16
MDALTEDASRADVDSEMRAMTPEDITGLYLEAGDEVEILRNSLREAVHDDNVRPKMQCLMMDSSFSMVTMQGEDSGIAWETTPSRCATPWASEAGSPAAVDLGCAAPGSVPAGKIIFVMDEELISRQKKTKERVNQKSKGERQRGVLGESSENVSGRPELVEVSQPNVKPEEGDEEEAHDSLVDKEQRLFSLVSEGSEILNIVVPPKLALVDEEESKEMVDNLSYLEDSLVPKASEETHDGELPFTGSDAAGERQVRPSPSVGTSVMDPPGAPVARPAGRGAAGNVDYFEAFALVEAQAPGSPAVIAQGQVDREATAVPEIQDAENPMQSGDNATATTTTLNNDKSDTLSLVEITSEHLDEVFYGGTGSYTVKPLEKDDGRGAPCKLPSKPSGSTLFGSQEDILTPIFLPDGPPKIIDQILLEEPKAMAFLYTDLYEEAVGSRKKEEDTESVTSQTSFHSRHSDREARGYLEKYVLIDETPGQEVKPSDEDKPPEEGPRVLVQDLYDFCDLLSAPEKGEMPNSEEEITDFFRSGDNASPCDVDPFPRSLEEDDLQTTSKTKAKTSKHVSIKVENTAKTPVDPLGVSSFEFLSEEPEWGGADDHPAAVDEKDVGTDQELWKQDTQTQKPVAPPRRKVTASPKTCLDLTPLTPVEVILQEKEEAGGKEQRVEEKETASPAEAADERDGGETTQPVCNVALLQNALAAMESPQTESAAAARDTKPAAAHDDETVEEMETSEVATQQTEPEVDVKSSELAQTEVHSDERGDSSAEPAKDKGQCVIL